jgi:hypothetical protein
MDTINQATQITVKDLDTLKNIVDLACNRGAFRGAEMTEVGTIYDKLTQFLDAVIAQAKAQEQATLTADSADNQFQGE